MNGYTKTRQVDQFGNVSYAVRDDSGEQIATIDRGGGSRWQVTLPSGSWVPVTSVKAGLDWLAWADSL